MAPQYLPAIASQSLGSSQYNTIETKLAACARHGFKAIELFYEDLKVVARSLPHTYPPQPAGTAFPHSTAWDEQLLAAASYVSSLCVRHRLEVLCLQPFMHYEGLLKSSEHDQRLAKLNMWFLIAERLQTDLIQIPSNFLPESECTSDRTKIVADLREVADLALNHELGPFRFAYEALCWGTHIDLWDEAWAVVKAVDRPNFGTCLDTFNICGRVWADPAALSGKNINADEDMQRSLEKLKCDIDVSKIFYVEVVDAERMITPLTSAHSWHSDDQKPRMSWSRNARLFPFEERGYLPILETLKVITEAVGYTGYISFELFSRTCNEPSKSVPEEHAARGKKSWKRLVEYMTWEDASGEEEEESGASEMSRQDSGVDVRDEK